MADVVCDGVDDQVEINQAALLAPHYPKSPVIFLCAGTYNIDSWCSTQAANGQATVLRGAGWSEPIDGFVSGTVLNVRPSAAFTLPAPSTTIQQSAVSTTTGAFDFAMTSEAASGFNQLNNALFADHAERIGIISAHINPTSEWAAIRGAVFQDCYIHGGVVPDGGYGMVGTHMIRCILLDCLGTGLFPSSGNSLVMGCEITYRSRGIRTHTGARIIGNRLVQSGAVVGTNYGIITNAGSFFGGVVAENYVSHPAASGHALDFPGTTGTLPRLMCRDNVVAGTINNPGPVAQVSHNLAV